MSIKINNKTISEITIGGKVVKTITIGGKIAYTKSEPQADYVVFEDSAVETICLANFDGNGDGKIQFGEASAVTSFGTLFQGTNITSFNEGVHFDHVVLTNSTFLNCTSLTSIKLAGSANNLYSEFNGCSAMVTCNLSQLNTSQVGFMTYMFNSCKSVVALNLSNFDTSNVTEMKSMFNGCLAMQTLNVSNFNTSKVTNMQFMFSDCKKLQALDLSSFNTDKVTNAMGMFYNLQQCVTLDMSNCDLSHIGSTNMLFTNCMQLTNFSIKALPNLSVSFGSSPNLTATSVESIIGALPQSTTSPTLTLKSAAIARYDAAHGASACSNAVTAKGWTLASA